MSLNLHLPDSQRVVRVHRPFVTGDRLLGEQRVRRQLFERGVITPVAMPVDQRTVLQCGRRLAEVEPFIESFQPEPSRESYQWQMHELGVLHRRLSSINTPLPKALAATWAPPGSLRRWLLVTVPALSVTTEGAALADRVVRATRHIRAAWVTPSRFPVQLIHGDFRPGNVRKTLDGKIVVLDFGFADRRPRVCDVAYTLAFMTLALRESDVTAVDIRDMVAAYATGYGGALTSLEIIALPAYAASVMLHAVAHDGFTAAPLASLSSRKPFVDIAEWLVDNGRAIVEVVSRQ